jgi:hypothetical protein
MAMKAGHIRTLTNPHRGKDSDPTTEILADRVKRLGDVESPGALGIHSILEVDRAMILIQLRMLSFDFSPNFRFQMNWPGTQVDEPLCSEHEYEFTENDFKVRKPKVIDATGQLVDAHYTSFEEVQQEFKLQMPGGPEVLIELTNKRNENLRRRLARAGVHAYSKIEMASPRYWDEKGNLNKLRIDDLTLPQTKWLGEMISALEGDIDTTIMVTHPENPSRVERVNVLLQPSFFLDGQV